MATLSTSPAGRDASSSGIRNNVHGGQNNNNADGNQYIARNMVIGNAANSQDDKEFMRSLYKHSGNYDRHLGLVDPPAPGSCEWILSDAKFEEWLDADCSSILWITANPGCGKTVLSRFIVEHLQKQMESLLVASFFFDDGDDGRDKSNQALCGLLHQTLTHKPDLGTSAWDEFDRKGESLFQSDENVWRIISSMSDVEQFSLAFVVDALDECSEASRNSFIKLLTTFFSPNGSTTPSVPLKLIITSRPQPDIERRLHWLYRSGGRIRCEDLVDQLNDQLEVVIRYQMKALRSDGTLTLAVSQKATKMLLQKADRTLLWQSLVVEKIRQLHSHGLKAVLQAIDRLPSALEDIYNQAFENKAMETNENAWQMLQFLLALSEPPTLGLVKALYATRPDITSLAELEDEIQTDDSIANTIKRKGGVFVRIIEGRVYFVHQTAREFLLEKGMARSVLVIPECHLAIAERCMRFLLLEGWGPLAERVLAMYDDWNAGPWNGTTVLEGKAPEWSHEFYVYSTRTWYVHADHGGLFDLPQCQAVFYSVHRLRSTPMRYWWASFDDSLLFGPREIDPWPMIDRDDYEYSNANGASMNGNLSFIKLYFLFALPAVSDTNVDEMLLRALENSVAGSHNRIVRWALPRLENLESHRGELLFDSVTNGNVEAFELLIEPGTDLSEPQLLGWEHTTFMEIAVDSDRIEILEMLRSKGVQVTSSAFSVVSIVQGVKLVKYLLECLDDIPAASKRADILRKAVESARDRGWVAALDLYSSHITRSLEEPWKSELTEFAIHAKTKAHLLALWKEQEREMEAAEYFYFGTFPLKRKRAYSV